MYPVGVDCAEIAAQPAASYLETPPFVLSQELGERTFGLSAVLMLFAFLVGATAIGAEWHHGTLTGLLLWEPRRIRVFLAKLTALLTGVTLVSVAAYAGQYGGLWLVARFRGMFGNFTPDVLAAAGLDAARGLALALVAGALGFAIAFTLRHTAAAMGAALAYFAIFELGVRSFFPPAPKYLPLTYMSAWLEKGAEVTYSDCFTGECGTSQFSVEMWGGGAYLLGLGLVALLIAAVVFRRREVA
jgi:ABC-type transport system involved in multi-copper enzyme maturation permease subunit